MHSQRTLMKCQVVKVLERERENGKGSSERKFTSTLWQLGMWLCVHCTCCVCVLSGGV